MKKKREFDHCLAEGQNNKRKLTLDHGLEKGGYCNIPSGYYRFN